MKEVKRETKIIVGVSITVILLAIIATVIVLAVKSAKRGTQLLSREYVAVQNDDGEVSMFDGLFIAAEEGGWVLAKEDKVLSKKYAELRLAEAQKKVYEFVTFDGAYGRLDEHGNETYHVKSNGNFIGDTAKYVDFTFCIYYEDGKQFARLGSANKSKGVAPPIESGRFDKIYKHSETEFVMRELGVTAEIENVLPSGVFLAKDNDKYYLANVGGEKLDLSAASIETLCFDFVTAVEASGRKTYSLPTLENILELDGVSGNKIFAKDGEIFFAGNGKIKRVGGAEFEVGFDVQKIIAVGGDNGKVIVYGGGDGAFYDGSAVTAGAFEDFGVIYRIGTQLVYAHNLTATTVESEEVSRIDADGKIFFFIGPVTDGTRPLYEFKDGALYLKSNAARTTYGNPYFASSRYNGEYETYFSYDGKVYDTDFTALADGIAVRKNLVRNGSTYTDMKGGNAVENVERVYDVFSYNGETLDEYLYAKADGLYTAKDKLTSAEFDSIIEIVFKSENGTYVFVTENGIICSGDTIRFAEYDDCVFMSKSNIALISDSRIRVVKATKRGFENVAEYGSFGASLDYTYKASVSARYGAVFGKVCAKGVVFRGGNGKAGLIDADGRLALSPVYDNVYLTQDFALIENDGKLAASDVKGRMVSEFEYDDVRPIGSMLMCRKADGSAVIINSRGNNIAKNVDFDSVLTVKNYVTVGGRQVLDNNVEYIFVRVGGKYKLVRIYD